VWHFKNHFTKASFGDCRFSQGTLATDRLFTGQRLDDTGLYYYGARYYDATIGRFISADTVTPNLTNPQALNRYSYALNNPLKYIDPSGHYVEIGDGALMGWVRFCQANPDLALELGRSNTQYVYQNSLPLDNSGTGLSGKSGTTTVRGSVTLSGDRSIVGDSGNGQAPPEPETIDKGTGDSNVTRVGSGLNIINYYLYPFSFLRTYDASQTISFTAALSFNSDSGVAQYNLSITSTYPQFYSYNPIVSSVLSRKYVDKVVSTLSGLNRQLPSK
jgi:RHS repeat-associated protein